jgi:hypothetical protein
MPPAHFMALVVTTCALVLVMTGTLAAGNRATAGPVYSLAGLEEKLDHAPRAWVGRSVLVRAVVEPCSWWARRTHLEACTGRSLLLVSGLTATHAAPMPLNQSQPVHVLSFLSGEPVIGGLVLALLRPAPAPYWGVEATYLVRLSAVDSTGCGASLCYEARLLAASP